MKSIEDLKFQKFQKERNALFKTFTEIASSVCRSSFVSTKAAFPSNLHMNQLSTHMFTTKKTSSDKKMGLLLIATTQNNVTIEGRNIPKGQSNSSI